MGKSRRVGRPISEKFDVSTPNNIFDSRFGSVQNIPVQHLFLSTEEISEKVIGNRKEFLTNKPYTRDLAFFNLQKVKYLSYRSDITGQRILSSAELKPLSRKKILSTTEPLICKLSLYIDSTLFNPENSFKKYKLCNSYFVIVPDQYNASTTPVAERESYKRIFQETYEQYSSIKFYHTGYLKGGICQEPSFRKETRQIQRPLATNSESEKEQAREINSLIPTTSKERREREQSESVQIMTNKAEEIPPVPLGEPPESGLPSPPQETTEQTQRREFMEEVAEQAEQYRQSQNTNISAAGGRSTNRRGGY